MQKNDSMPHTVVPMLCVLVEEPFDREGWFFEPKWDGYRAIAEIENGKVRLYSRNNINFNEKYEPIVSSLDKIKHDVVMDGEIVLMESGKPNFQKLQNWNKNIEGNLEYIVFDLLYLDGQNLMKLSLKERKKKLEEFLPKLPRISFGEHVETKGKEFFEAAKKQGLEGMIAKDSQSPYLAGQRTNYWQKIKTHMRQEVVICGFTRARGSREKFGALILGIYEKGELIYVGHTGTGFDQRSLESVHNKLIPLIQKECPFETAPKTNEQPTWVKPKLVCEISFSEWTEGEQMRQPVFMGLREDKKSTEVKRE